jgi:carbamate kinase
LCSSLLAQDLNADVLLIATDVAAIYLEFGSSSQHALGTISPEDLAQYDFPAGSMAPKVQAACDFVQATGKRAVIGSLDDIEAMLAGTAGTQVRPHSRDA